MKKFFGYVRVSTVKQGEGVSLQEQRDAIVGHAGRFNLQIAGWFQEKETAAKRGRPVFTGMLKLLSAGKADGVIIHKIDRSARNLKDWADLGELIDRGIDVHFANENLDLHSRGGRLSADIQAVVAADYIRNLREETRKGFYGRLKQGLYPLPAPLGYLDKGKGKPKEPDPEKAPLVRKAFELYGTGRYNLDRLLEELHQLGLRNRSGTRFSKNGLSVLLNNPFYIGLIRLRSGETFQGNQEPLIPKSLFDRVQKVLRGKINLHSLRHEFLFRRTLSCRHCGYSPIGELQKGHAYYRCHTRKCPTKCIREEIIEERALEVLQPLHFEEREKQYLRNKIEEMKKEWRGQQDEHVVGLKLQLTKINDRLNRLTDAFIDGSVEKDLFEQRKSALLMERRDLDEKLNGAKQEFSSVPDRLAEFLELAGSAWLSYKTALPEEKRDFLKIATSNRYVDGKNVEFTLSAPFREVANRFNNSNGAPHRDRPRTWDALIGKLAAYFKDNPVPAKIRTDEWETELAPAV
jgi:site-specific DNA recombinase